MRTTLTLDDDVVARIRRLRDRAGSFKQLVNEALRRGLDDLEAAEAPETARPTRAVSLGGAIVPNVDDVWGVIAAAEGDTHR